MNVYLKLVGVCLLGLLSSGCMGLSLFSNDHKHFHGGEELRQRVECLERRVDQLEGKSSSSTSSTVTVQEVH